MDVVAMDAQPIGVASGALERTVARLDRWPAAEPTGYLVGFSVACGIGSDPYAETFVAFRDAAELTPAQVVEAAWERVRRDLASQAAVLVAGKTIVGTSAATSIAAMRA